MPNYLKVGTFWILSPFSHILTFFAFLTLDLLPKTISFVFLVFMVLLAIVHSIGITGKSVIL